MQDAMTIAGMLHFLIPLFLNPPGRPGIVLQPTAWRVPEAEYQRYILGQVRQTGGAYPADGENARVTAAATVYPVHPAG